MKNLLLPVVLISFLTACGGSSDNTSATPASSSSSNLSSASSIISSSSEPVTTSASSSSELQSSSLQSSTSSEANDSSASSSNPVSSFSSASSSSAAPGEETTTKPDHLYGMYVSTGANKEDGLLGDTEKENALLTFIRDNGFNYLIMYDLWSLDVNSPKATQLASFIKRAKAAYGIYQVAAAFGRAEDADIVVGYNNAHAVDERIDVLNLEYEFWNQAERAVAFNTALTILQSFKTVALANNLETETYIGWITAEEGAQLGSAADRILVHFYRPDDLEIIYYGIERLEYLAAANEKVRISPIFSNEGPTNTADIPFMGSWLETHPNEQAFNSWTAGYNSVNGSWKSRLEITGPTWFVYKNFLDVNPGASNHITSHPEDQTACPDDTVMFSVASNASEKRFCWMFKGQCLTDGGNISGAETATLTLSNITNADLGRYYARVTSYDSSNPASFASNDAKLIADNNCPMP